MAGSVLWCGLSRTKEKRDDKLERNILILFSINFSSSNIHFDIGFGLHSFIRKKRNSREGVCFVLNDMIWYDIYFRLHCLILFGLPVTFIQIIIVFRRWGVYEPGQKQKQKHRKHPSTVFIPSFISSFSPSPFTGRVSCHMSFPPFHFLSLFLASFFFFVF